MFIFWGCDQGNLEHQKVILQLEVVHDQPRFGRCHKIGWWFEQNIYLYKVIESKSSPVLDNFHTTQKQQKVNTYNFYYYLYTSIAMK